jgi:hypothetical protein
LIELPSYGYHWLYEISETDAVMRELPDIPNVMPLELAKLSVPVETLWVPALIPNGVSAATLAVSVDPFAPNETPLLLAHDTPGPCTLVVPAVIVLIAETEAVSVDPFAPKATPLESAHDTPGPCALVVPALIDRIATATLAVSVDPFAPNDTPLESAHDTPGPCTFVVPALIVLTAATLAVSWVEPERPNDTPLLFANETVPLPAVWVPADSATPAPADAVTVWPFMPNDTPLLFAKDSVGPVAVEPEAITDRNASIEPVTRLEPPIPNERPLESANRTVPVLAICVPAEIATPAPPPTSSVAPTLTIGSPGKISGTPTRRTRMKCAAITML